ncbi:ABC transporter permease [Oxalobacteraceae bacterium A2-2]
MFKDYYLMSLRSLVKNPLFSAINILGLTVGMACCILITMVVKYELSFDRHFSDAGQIYRLGTEIRLPGHDDLVPLAGTVMPATPQLKLDYASAVQAYARMQGNMLSFRRQHEVFAENVYFADPDFFQVFDLPFVAGSAQAALQQPLSVVLTRSMARKYFGDADPVGKTLPVEDRGELKVTGVIEDVPQNTHFDLGIVISMNSMEALMGPESAEQLLSWEPVESAYGYIKLKPGAAIRPLRQQLDAFLARNAGEVLQVFPFKVNLQRLDDIHLHPGSDEPAPARGSHIAFVYGAIILGLLILATACINFINLTTARMSQRTREVGIRKTVGAHYGQLVTQLMAETLALVLIATALAYGLARLLLPLLGNLLDREFGMAQIWDLQFALGVAVLVLATTVLAGLYPSLVLSRIPVVRALKGEQGGGRPRNRLRQGLIVVQFTLATMLIIVTMAGSAQVDLLKHLDLGYRQDQTWMLTPMRSDSATFRFMEDVQENFETMRVELARGPGITGVTGSFAPRIKAGNFNVRKPSQQPGERVSMNGNQVDADYVKVMGIKLLAGRGFSRDMAGDLLGKAGGAAILTRSGARKLGYSDPKDAIAQKIVFNRSELEVIGVTEDVNAAGGYRALNLDILVNSNRINAVIVRLDGERAADALAHIEKTWTRLLPQRPLNRFPIADIYAMQRGAFDRIVGVFGAFAILAISIACFGLYAIAQFVAERRSKEIVMRKVLGASVADIVRLMLWDFSKPIMLALAIAVPLAILFLAQVLNRFPQHVTMGFAAFATAAVTTVGLALMTVSLHTWRVANMNPAQRLHQE